MPMSLPAWSLRRLHALEDAQMTELATVLIDCVEGGASVSFMQPLTRDRAVAFWRGVAQGVSAGQRPSRCWPPKTRTACAAPFNCCWTNPRTNPTAPMCPRCWCIAAPAAKVWGRR